MIIAAIEINAGVVVVGALSSLAVGLILYHVTSLKKTVNSLFIRFEKQDKKIEKLALDRLACKNDCDMNNVNKVEFIRQSTHQEEKLDKALAMLYELSGSMKSSMEQMPKIMAGITKEIVSGIKDKG